MQRVASGRASRRAAADVPATVLAVAVLTRVDPGQGGVNVVELRLQGLDQAEHLGSLGGGGSGVGESVPKYIRPQLARLFGAEFGQLVDEPGPGLTEAGPD